MEILERLADNGGILLRAERQLVQGVDGTARADAFLLTFDVGRLLASVDVSSGGLHFLVLEVGNDPPGERVLADEDEPWWRVLGSPLVKASEDDARGVVTLQFRKDGDNPRVVTLRPEGELVVVGLDPIA